MALMARAQQKLVYQLHKVQIPLLIIYNFGVTLRQAYTNVLRIKVILRNQHRWP